MAAVNRLKIHNASPRGILYRDYAAILLSDSEDPKEVETLRQLVIELEKTPGEAKLDVGVLAKVRRLRSVIQDARYEAPKLAEANDAARGHWRETQQLMGERQKEQDRLSGIVSALQAKISEAEAAVEEINHLKADNRELLAHEPAASAADLKA